MSYINSVSETKRLMPEDNGFTFVDGLVLTPRAAITVTEDCPDRYRDIITLCFNKGWLKPVAYMPTKEFVWDKLHERIYGE